MNMNMNINSNKKMIYVPPMVEVTTIILEGGIAVQSPVRTIKVEKWEIDEPTLENNADIVLPF